MIHSYVLEVEQDVVACTFTLKLRDAVVDVTTTMPDGMPLEEDDLRHEIELYISEIFPFGYETLTGSHGLWFLTAFDFDSYEEKAHD